MIKIKDKGLLFSSLKNRVGAILATLTVVTGVAGVPVSAFGIMPATDSGLTQNIEIDVKTASAIAFPVPETIGLSQGYSFFHPGVDIRAPQGSAIYPVKSGTVAYVGYQVGGYGRHVMIDNGDGVESLYAHMNKVDVYEGDVVTPETQIGEVGLTGHTTGPHLHLEIRVHGQTVNPLTYLGSLDLSRK
jgi:murein DD-endopeptidase MepM/ murein hydrolase activator NlpD